ncbi:ABC transporter ATP-binding protein [Polymorphospora lycopeni]|uniref:ABC transporter ATP-binding protein n=1 Tax=Polymorphospora lycopeni TaxID=3140240 RepID=A0ABV5CYQ5_9ACTN
MSGEPAEHPPVLDVRDLEVVYHQRGRPPVRAVAGASLTVAAGQIVGLVGESGCGKSTVAKAVMGLVTASAGAVHFEGGPVLPIRRRVRPPALLGLQMVFQNPYASLNPRRRIGRQVCDGLVGPAAAARTRSAAELLEQVGLPATTASRYPHELSGGQRQRVAIARALATSPSMLVLDEPLSSLDVAAQRQIAELLVRLKSELGVAMLLISHDLGVVRQIADAVSVMYLGRVVESAPTGELWRDPRHPYTRALIDAVPSVDGAGRLPVALPGEIPDPADPPPGCRFHPRCPQVLPRCATDDPPLLRLAPVNREAACWLREPASTPR